MASRREEVVTLGAIRKRGKHYAIRYYDATGKRRWETVGPNLQEARQVLADRMWERRNGKFRLSRPGEELILIEPQVLPELDVWHLVGPGALVKPGHLDAKEPGRLLNGQERHRLFLVVVAPRVAVGSTSTE